jgi:hypothetical protein
MIIINWCHYSNCCRYQLHRIVNKPSLPDVFCSDEALCGRYEAGEVLRAECELTHK